MAEWGEDDEYGDQEEEEEDSQGMQPGKDQVVMLIDARPQMHESYVALEEGGPVVSYFAVAVDMVRSIMKDRIFTSPTDEYAVMFFGTKTAKNDSNMDSVYTYLSLEQSDPTRLKELEDLTGDRFSQDIGPLDPSDSGRLADSLRTGLWAASGVLMNKSKSSRLVYIFTCDDLPVGQGPNAGEFRRNVMNRVGELKHAQIELQFVPLPTPKKLFDMELFWQHLLKESLQSEGSSVETDFAFLLDMAEKKDLSRAELDEYTSATLRKGTKRRSVARLNWTLTDGTKIAVQVYNLVQPATKPSHIVVSALTNEVLRMERRLLHAETNAMLTDQDKVTVFRPDKPVADFPTYVRMSRDVVAAVKHVAEPGLELLGFKPQTHIRPSLHAGHSSFVRPNDGEVKGSSTAFKSLLDALVRTEKVAICRYRRGKSSDARLVALFPERGTVDVNGVQHVPAGFHLVQLAYADDIRFPERDVAVMGLEIFHATEDQVQKAEEMIDALCSDEYYYNEFDPKEVRNPALLRVQLAIEARAVGREPEWTPEMDGTLPDLDAIEKHHNAIQALTDALYGPDGNIDGSKGTKRKAEAKQQSAEDAADEYNRHDWGQLCSKPGGLEKLTIPVLKTYLKTHKLALSGNKGDVCKRIRDHMEQQG